MIEKWAIKEPRGKRRGCLIALPGRGMPLESMWSIVERMELPDTLAVILEPTGLQWYPQPHGAYDQDDAVEGLKIAIAQLNKRITKIQRCFHLRRQQIALFGYSAGAVLAIQMAALAKQPFAAVVSMAGAILEPDEMPVATNQTPILLRHAIDDDCFSWEERYLPMKNSLLDRGYNLYASEKNRGGHGINLEDVIISARFIGQELGYTKELE